MSPSVPGVNAPIQSEPGRWNPRSLPRVLRRTSACLPAWERRNQRSPSAADRTDSVEPILRLSSRSRLGARLSTSRRYPSMRASANSPGVPNQTVPAGPTATESPKVRSGRPQDFTPDMSTAGAMAAEETAGTTAATSSAASRRRWSWRRAMVRFVPFIRELQTGPSPPGAVPPADGTALAEFARVLAEELAGDDQELDLLGALEDVEDLRVAGPLLEQLGLAEADGAAELDAAEGDVDARAPRLRLRHRGLEAVGLRV